MNPFVSSSHTNAVDAVSVSESDDKDVDDVIGETDEIVDETLSISRDMTQAGQTGNPNPHTGNRRREPFREAYEKRINSIIKENKSENAELKKMPTIILMPMRKP